jgi:hypothetical protein
LTAAKQIWAHRLDKHVRLLPRKGPRR